MRRPRGQDTAYWQAVRSAARRGLHVAQRWRTCSPGRRVGSAQRGCAPFRVHAKCIAGQQAEAQRRIEEAMRAPADESPRDHQSCAAWARIGHSKSDSTGRSQTAPVRPLTTSSLVRSNFGSDGRRAWDSNPRGPSPALAVFKSVVRSGRAAAVTCSARSLPTRMPKDHPAHIPRDPGYGLLIRGGPAVCLACPMGHEVIRPLTLRYQIVPTISGT